MKIKVFFRLRILLLVSSILMGILLGSPVLAEVRKGITFQKITKINYTGLSSIDLKDFSASIPVNIGDYFNDNTFSQIEKSATEYLQKRGFYSSQIKVSKVKDETDGVSVEVKVEQGKACVISKLSISDPPTQKSIFLWKRMKDSLYERVGFKVGDRYDEILLSDNLRNLKDWLVSKDYIIASTDQVKLKYNDSFTEVDVFVNIDYGDQVSFGFQDSTVFTNGELNEMILQLRATGLGKDYAGVIQRKFAEEYLSRAYFDIKIDSVLSEKENSKHITFIFNEGVRAKLQGLQWEGISKENEEFVKNSFDKNSSRLIQRGFFVEKDIDKTVLLVLEDLRTKGYLGCKLISKNIIAVKTPRNVHEKRFSVSILVSEGEQTVVGDLSIKGNKFFNEDSVLNFLVLKKDEPFNPFAFEEGLQKLKNAYLAQGFLDFKVETPESQIVYFSENNRLVKIKLEIQEGTRYKIGKINIKGLKKTRENVVLRELTVETGAWWLNEVVSETDSNIKALGLFSEVKIIPTSSSLGSEYKDLSIELIELDPGVIEAGPGFRSDLGFRLFSRASYNNLLGRNWITSLGAEGNRRFINYKFIEYKFDVNFTEPRFFDSKFQYFIELSTRKQSFPPDFNAVSTQLLTSFDRRFWKHLIAKLSYKIERIRQFDVYYQQRLLADDNRSMLISSFVPSITVDFRDSPFIPTKGFLVNAYLEYASPAFAFQGTPDNTLPSYQKWNMSFHKYTSITKDILWSQVISGGFLRSNSKDVDVPLIKRFRLGGYSTIRGFQEDSIHSDDKKITGTLSYLNMRTQVDIPLIGELKVSPFLDMGNLYFDRFEGSPFFRAGAGIGLHYVTPVGPINLDWGQKLNPNGGSTYQIHFSVGAI